ncbi:hypothetical protein C0V97_07605 [Asaia sp. W19]|nr:hypothetical protein C0V97_07605 [Asaia sp. W19]
MGPAAPMTPYSWLGYGASFALVISLIFLMRIVVKYLEPRVSRGRSTKSLHVTDTLALDPKRRLTIFSCSERRGLILTGPNSDLFIGWLDEEARVVTPPAASMNEALYPESSPSAELNQ